MRQVNVWKPISLHRVLSAWMYHSNVWIRLRANNKTSVKRRNNLIPFADEYIVYCRERFSNVYTDVLYSSSVQLIAAEYM